MAEELSGLIESKFKIVSKIDPLYELKSIKNPTEIKNTIKCHIEDGVALTKFLFWFKNNKRVITEKIIEDIYTSAGKNNCNIIIPLDCIVSNNLLFYFQDIYL
mgnify:CR=1 FL=1